MNILTRRRLLAAIAQLAAAAAIVSCDSKQSGSDGATVTSTSTPPSKADDLTTLASICFDLFPYEELSPQLYVKVAEKLLDMNSSMLSDGLAQLKSKTKGEAWPELPEADRVAILTELEDSEFFTLVRITTIEVLYREPELFALLGYGGSAIEKGGYINRGFDDINWLPAE